MNAKFKIRLIEFESSSEILYVKGPGLGEIKFRIVQRDPVAGILVVPVKWNTLSTLLWEDRMGSC